MLTRRLERKLERELKLARQPALTIYEAKRASGDRRIRGVKIWMIQGIVGLGSKLQAHALGDREMLDQRKVPL